MRIMVLNPNTSESHHCAPCRCRREAAAPGTVIVPLTAPRGVPSSPRAPKPRSAAPSLLEMLAERHQDVDAVIIAAFGDPGLFWRT